MWHKDIDYNLKHPVDSLNPFYVPGIVPGWMPPGV